MAEWGGSRDRPPPLPPNPQPSLGRVLVWDIPLESGEVGSRKRQGLTRPRPPHPASGEPTGAAGIGASEQHQLRGRVEFGEGGGL
eukprot:8034885-Alexandrium_andersonii.AAC.1